MKKIKKYKYYILFVIILVLIGIIAIIYFKDKEVEENNNYKIELSYLDNCTESMKTYSQKEKDYKVNLICINTKESIIYKNERRVHIEDYIYSEDFDKLLQILKDKSKSLSTYRDGGSKMFKDSEFELSNNGFSVLMCNKHIPTGTNTDVYIGNLDMKYEDYMCE